jgi:hypothetical protein
MANGSGIEEFGEVLKFGKMASEIIDDQWRKEGDDMSWHVNIHVSCHVSIHVSCHIIIVSTSEEVFSKVFRDHRSSMGQWSGVI